MARQLSRVEEEDTDEMKHEGMGTEGCVYVLPEFPNTIFVTGTITDQSATSFYQCVHEMDFREPMRVVLNSVGGELVAALAIIDLMEMIKDMGCELVTISCGEAYSAAALILACGTPGQRYMSRSSYGMVHDMQAFAFGNLTTDIRPRVKHLDELHEKYISTMARARLKLMPHVEPSEEELLNSKAHVHNLFQQGDLFLDAQAMIDQGFVDHARLLFLKMPPGVAELVEEIREEEEKPKKKKASPKRTRKPKTAKEVQ